jgi:hypothetical protein
MTARRIRDVALGLVLAGVSFLGVLYQVNESSAAGPDGKGGEVPRLICPLH